MSVRISDDHMSDQNHSLSSSPTTLEKLAFTAAEVNQLLSISSVTRWRLEKRRLLLPVAGLRTKLYSRRAVEAFLAGRKGD